MTMELVVLALREALQRVASDGRVPRDIASRLRAALIQQKRQRAMMPSGQLIDALPAFETLPETTRQSLFATVSRDDSWSMALRRANWRQGLTRAIRSANLKIPPRHRRLKALLEQMEFVLLYWQARVVHV